MAKEVLATYEAVVAAAEALEKDGLRPSVRNITARVGGGSPNTISEHRRKWLAERPRIESRRSIVIDQSISDSIAAALQKTADEASAAAIAERDEANDEKDLIAQRGVELEREVEQLGAQVNDLTEKRQHDAGLIQALRAEVEKMNSDAAAAIARVRDEAATAVAEARAEASKERARADLLVAELATANVELKSLRTVKEELDRTAAELRSEHEQRIVAEANAGVIPRLEADLIEMRAAVKAANERADAERSKLDEVRSNASAAIAQSRAAAVDELNALRAQLEQRIDAERKAAADAEKATAAAASTAAAEKARADALAAQLAEKSKNVAETNA